ncbi:MAG TPA: hypothetical protein VKR58_15195 [Aquella sp.]|nr:hypothetical protein [Aquella sp.]
MLKLKLCCYLKPCILNFICLYDSISYAATLDSELNFTPTQVETIKSQVLSLFNMAAQG